MQEYEGIEEHFREFLAQDGLYDLHSAEEEDAVPVLTAAQLQLLYWSSLYEVSKYH